MFLTLAQARHAYLSGETIVFYDSPSDVVYAVTSSLDCSRRRRRNSFNWHIRQAEAEAEGKLLIEAW